MLDTIAGLPVHTLVVHLVVVGLPVMSLVTILVAVRSAWRQHAVAVAVLDLLLLGATLVARKSGETFQQRLGGQVAIDHGTKGKLLLWFALALFVAALVTVVARSRASLVPVAVVLAVLTGVAATGWTVVVGDTGARAVWEGVVDSTQAPG